MSTAYPPRLVRYLFSSKKERDAARAATMQPGYYGQFPSIFGLYYIGHGKDFLSLNFQLSSLEPREDLYAVTFHKGPGTLQATIYSTPTHGSTPMAVATNEKRYGSSTAINIPNEDGRSVRTERLQYSGFVSNVYSFNWGGEAFEVRVDSKGRPKAARIVRVGAPGSSRDSHASESKRPVEPNGKQEELVATWTEGSIPNREGRLATFKFADCAPVQRFGEDWALFAVAATLAICQRGAAIEVYNRDQVMA